MRLVPRLAPARLLALASGALAGAGGLGLTACAPSQNWRAVWPEQAEGLAAQFPCKPDVQTRQVPWPGVTGGVLMHLLSCRADEHTWALSYFTLADVNQVGPALAQWPRLLRTNFEQVAGSVNAVTARDTGPVNVPRMTPSAQARAWMFQGPRPDGLGRPMTVQVHAWHFSHGLTVFQASVSGEAVQAPVQSSEDVAFPFLQGFHFPS